MPWQKQSAWAPPAFKLCSLCYTKWPQRDPRHLPRPSRHPTFQQLKPPDPHHTNPGSWHTPSQAPTGPAPANPSPAPQGLPLTTPPAFTPSIGAAVQAAPGIPLGLPTGASLINLSPPPQQDTVTVWMEGRAFQIPTAMVRGVN